MHRVFRGKAGQWSGREGPLSSPLRGGAGRIGWG